MSNLCSSVSSCNIFRSLRRSFSRFVPSQRFILSHILPAGIIRQLWYHAMLAEKYDVVHSARIGYDVLCQAMLKCIARRLKGNRGSAWQRVFDLKLVVCVMRVCLFIYSKMVVLKNLHC